MAMKDDEEELLRSVALQNAQSILIARQRAEDALRKQSEWLRVTLASIGDAVISTDAEGSVTFMNGIAESLTGWTQAEALGHPLPDIFHIINEQNRQPVDNPAIRALREGNIVGLANHTTLIAKDGTEWPIDDSAAPIRNDQGEVGGVVLVFREITERKQAEDQLRELAANLSEADRRKNEFLAMLAHELRNPLAPIRNALQIVRLSDSNSEAVKSASEIMERQIDQMVRLVDDLLDVSRISRGKIELRRERVELSQIIHQAIETSRPAVDQARQELTVMLPPQPVYVHADPVRLAQVFSNLLNNSCKYSEPEGHIWLTAEQQGSDVVVSVKDTGIGIPLDMLPKIFEMFTQVDRSLDRSQGGLGIGLSLV
ncbi:MAG: ATP-binding protein, partial [Acidobacteriota bacterium]|nr:ATP-binding protein [Acidobacteriota bacterium]